MVKVIWSIISNTKLTLTNHKLTLNPDLNPTLLTIDLTQYRYYGTTKIIDLCVAAVDGGNAALPVSFARVCFMKFIFV